MLQREIFIIKVFSVYRFASSPIVISEITPLIKKIEKLLLNIMPLALQKAAYLTHEIWNHTMKDTALKSETSFSCTELSKIFRGFGYHVGSYYHHNSSDTFPSNINVEITLRKSIRNGIFRTCSAAHLLSRYLLNRMDLSQKF